MKIIWSLFSKKYMIVCTDRALHYDSNSSFLSLNPASQLRLNHIPFQSMKMLPETGVHVTSSGTSAISSAQARKLPKVIKALPFAPDSETRETKPSLHHVIDLIFLFAQ